MNLETESYPPQHARWPTSGQQILAQYDDESIIVYQTYSPEIGSFAVTQGYFGGPFSLNRMSWIKPNFLWMMYRSGWGTKPNQEVILAVRLKHSGFDEILKGAVYSAFVHQVYGTEAIWKKALESSSVRLQWDPDHRPSGAKLERRAIQLGLRGATLAKYARDWIISIQDISSFVREQHQLVAARRYNDLITPREEVYPVSDQDVATRLGIRP